MMTRLLLSVGLALALLAGATQAKIWEPQYAGSRKPALWIESGDTVHVFSGGILNVASGATVILHGLTLSSGELGALDGVTLGTAAASKVLTLSAAGALTFDVNGTITIGDGDTLNITTGTGFQIGGVSLTSSIIELNSVDVTALGAVEASKVVTASATSKVTFGAGPDTLNIDASAGGVYQIDETTVTSSALELNLNDGLVTGYATIATGQARDTATVTGIGSTRELISVWVINADSSYGVTVRMAGTNAVSFQRPGADVYTAATDSIGYLYCPNCN